MSAACAGNKRGNGPVPPFDSTASQAGQGEIGVLVENHNSDDVVITVRSASGQVRRLGTVAGNGRSTFTFSERFAAASRQLVLIAHPVGARGNFQSQTFTVQSGQSVSWEIDNGYTGSSVTVH